MTVDVHPMIAGACGAAALVCLLRAPFGIWWLYVRLAARLWSKGFVATFSSGSSNYSSIDDMLTTAAAYWVVRNSLPSETSLSRCVPSGPYLAFSFWYGRGGWQEVSEKDLGPPTYVPVSDERLGAYKPFSRTSARISGALLDSEVDAMRTGLVQVMMELCETPLRPRSMYSAFSVLFSAFDDLHFEGRMSQDRGRRQNYTQVTNHVDSRAFIAYDILRDIINRNGEAITVLSRELRKTMKAEVSGRTLTIRFRLEESDIPDAVFAACKND